MRLVGTDEVIRQNALNLLDTAFHNLFIIRTAILPQQELQDIHGDISPFLDFLGQVFADDFAVKMLTKFPLDDFP